MVNTVFLPMLIISEYMTNIKLFKHIISVLMLLISLSVIISCDETKEEPVDMGYKYWPVDSGCYWIYQVDSIVWDDFYNPVKIDTYRYKVKEVIKGEIQDEEGRKVQRVERLIKPHDSLDWKINKILTMTRENSIALKTKDNETFVKLAFPVALGKSWDGNSYNTLKEDEYEYISVDENVEVAGNTYKNSIIVEQENFESLISNDIAKEIYAPGIGMIRKYFVEQELNSSGEVKSGVKYSYKLLKYGKE